MNFWVLILNDNLANFYTLLIEFSKNFSLVGNKHFIVFKSMANILDQIS